MGEEKETHSTTCLPCLPSSGREALRQFCCRKTLLYFTLFSTFLVPPQCSTFLVPPQCSTSFEKVGGPCNFTPQASGKCCSIPEGAEGEKRKAKLNEGEDLLCEFDVKVEGWG